MLHEEVFELLALLAKVFALLVDLGKDLLLLLLEVGAVHLWVVHEIFHNALKVVLADHLALISIWIWGLNPAKIGPVWKVLALACVWLPSTEERILLLVIHPRFVETKTFWFLTLFLCELPIKLAHWRTKRLRVILLRRKHRPLHITRLQVILPIPEMIWTSTKHRGVNCLLFCI